MTTSDKTLNQMFTDEQLNVGKVLIMSSNHNIPTHTIERLIRSTLIELDRESSERDALLEYVVENSFAALNQRSFNGYEIYIADGTNPCSSLLRAAESASFVAAVEIDAADLKSLHNASVSHKHISNARNAMLRAKNAHNALVTLTKKSKALQCFAKRTPSLNAATRSYGIQTLKKLEKGIAKQLAKTW